MARASEGVQVVEGVIEGRERRAGVHGRVWASTVGVRVCGARAAASHVDRSRWWGWQGAMRCWRGRGRRVARASEGSPELIDSDGTSNGVVADFEDLSCGIKLEQARVCQPTARANIVDSFYNSMADL